MSRRGSDFRRKIWLWLLRLAVRHLPVSDVLELLDPFWWEVVRYRLQELSATDLGLNTVKVIVGPMEREREIRDSHFR